MSKATPFPGLKLTLVLLGLVLFLSALPPLSTTAHAEAEHAHLLAAIAAPNVVQTSTANRYFFSTQNWNQTGTTVYAGRSMAWANFTFNPGGSPTAIFTTAMTFTVSTNLHNVPRVYVYQGTTQLVNTTSNRFTVSPAVSATVVTERIVALSNATGGAPPTALYPVFTNVSESIQFDVVSAGNWTYNNTTYSSTRYVNSTNSYFLNATTLSLPIVPGATVNLTSLNVTVNRSGATYQLATNSLFILLTTVTPGASDKIVAKFQPVPTILAKAPVLYFGTFTTHGTLLTGQYVFTNYLVPAYNGLFILQVNYSTPIANVNVSANGHVFPATQLSQNGNNISILPGSFTLYLNQRVLFQVTFTASSVAPGLPGLSAVLFSPGGVAITLGTAVLAFILIDGFYIFYVVATSPTRRRFYIRSTARQAWTPLWGPLTLLLILVLVYVVASVSGA